ncbi:response regulator [Pseudoflavitalea rhizosphaerae]|uniref:response regulator n=1 Tax=Pseudoflavitalea rhizosphaerae TaxID=1884793 RepID=UPI000F8CE0DC|nr:response regulator [Pseudoflavitalea rhizosphaerae]
MSTRLPISPTRKPLRVGLAILAVLMLCIFLWKMIFDPPSHGYAYLLWLMGTLCCLIIIMLDLFVAARNQLIAKALQEKDLNSLSYALNFGWMGSWKLNLLSSEVTLSKEFMSLLGEEPKETSMVFSTYMQRYVPPDTHVKLKEMLILAMENRHNPDFEASFDHPIRRRNGSIAHIFVRARIMNENEGFGIARDITDLKNAETELALKEKRFRLLAEYSDDIISEHKPNSEFVYISPSVKKILGYTPEEIEGRTVLEFLHPEDIHKFAPTSQYLDAFNTRDNLIVRYRMRTRQGTYTWLESIVKPIRENGKVTGVISTSRDITERKIYEDEVKQNKELLRTVIDSTPDWIFIKDNDFKFRLVNQGFANALNKLPEDFIGKTDIEVGFPEEAVMGNKEKGIHGFHEDDAQVLQTGKSKMVIEESYMLNGRRITMSVVKVPVLDADKKRVTGILGYAHDISELKEASEKLLQDEKLRRSLASASHLLLSNANLEAAMGDAMKRLGEDLLVDHVEVFTNEQQRETNEWKCTRLLTWKRNMDDVIQHRNPAESTTLYPDSPVFIALQNRKVYHGNVSNIVSERIREYYHSEGVQSIAVIPIFNQQFFWGFAVFRNNQVKKSWSDAEVSALEFFSTTLTAAVERKQMEKELIEARNLAESASLAKSNFMANMSHELRTPMNGIIGFTDLVLTTNLQTVQYEYLSNVKKSAYGLLEIINDILEFSKIEAGKLQIDHIQFPLDTLVQESVDILTVKAHEKKLEVICHIDPELPSQFVGDPTRIRQILVNLLGNAIKFTPAGEIFISLIVGRGIHLENEKRIMDVVLSVQDTGIGISPQQLARIFDSFTQADVATTRNYGGTGLGLTISKSLAEMMGGAITVASELGKGSTFSLTLPMEVADEVPHSAGEEKPPLRKVLVIDDNSTNRWLMQEILRHFNISSETASGAREALEVLDRVQQNNEPLDLIITDHHMPEMNGIQLVQEMRKRLGELSQPTILMLSSIEKNEHQEAATALGIHRFLTKPVKMHELHELLCSIFNTTQEKTTTAPKKENKLQKGNGAAILVVEDEPVNMMLISEILGRMGFKVLQAKNGREAINLLQQTSPALIFMDVNMPEMDGYATTRHIRSMPGPNQHIPIIALTADAMEGDKENCLRNGMDDYLAKPFQIEELTEMLKRQELVS